MMCNQQKTGLTIIEAVASLALIALLLTVVGQALVLNQASNQLSQQRVQSQFTLSNFSQRVHATNYDLLDQAWADQQQLDQAFIEAYPGATLEVKISSVNQPHPGKKCEVLIHWPEQKRETYELAIWRFASQDQEPSS